MISCYVNSKIIFLKRKELSDTRKVPLDETYLNSTSASTKRTCQSNAATFDQNKHIILSTCQRLDSIPKFVVTLAFPS